MTETVEYRLEQFLPELQDLIHKDLFTQEEIRQIIKKRTEHEHILLRRTAKKADYLRYINYEMNLESLRQKRAKRIKNPGKKTISDYAGPKRIRALFERATKRYQDISLWLQYIEYSKSQDSAKLTGKLFGQALQKFPSSNELWILAAQFEYESKSNIPGARNLLLRAIRLNPEKRELWWEYAKLECLYILKIMERRRVLGLDDLPKEDIVHDTGFEGDMDEIALPSITQEELSKSNDPEKEKDLLLSPLTNVATNPALNGAVIMAVYTSAIESRPDDVVLLAGFYDVLEPFYAGLSFISSALDTVKTRLEEKFPDRGKTLFVRIRDHAPGIDPTDAKFPSALREMMKTANAIPSLDVKERKVCCSDLLAYLEKISNTANLDENIQKVISIFKGRVGNWKDIS